MAETILPAFPSGEITDPLPILELFPLFYCSTILGALPFADNRLLKALFSLRERKKNSKPPRPSFRLIQKNSELALRFGQACFDWAEFAEENTQREKIAREGIAACRLVVTRVPKAAAGHYYLAMNLGQLARTKIIGALRIVNEMETEFQLARDLDEKLDFAGTDRNLGLLYSEAPGWPTSIGNRNKARHHLQRAVLLHPNYPENRLNLLEAYLKWGDDSGAKQEFAATTKLWPSAKKQFSGEAWELSWTDWEKRWAKLQIKWAELEKKPAALPDKR